MLLKFLRNVFLFQDRVLYLVAYGVLLQTRTVCTDFFWTIIEKSCLLFLLHMLLLSKPNMVSQSYRCFLAHFPVQCQQCELTWQWMRLTASFCSLVARTSEEFISAASNYLLKVFWGALEVVYFSSLWVSSLIFFLSSFFFVCLFVSLFLVWFGLVCSRPVSSFWHSQVYALVSGYRFFIWLWRNGITGVLVQSKYLK